MSGEKYEGYDLDDVYGDIPRISDAEVDAAIDERQQREIEEFSAERINAAIRKLNELLK